MEYVGEAVFVPDEDGESRCPLCFLIEEHARSCEGPPCKISDEWFEEWIPSVAEHVEGEWARLVEEEKMKA
jgi:hypothetical protein